VRFGKRLNAASLIVNVDGEAGAVIDRYVRGITLLASDVHGYYLFNAHGDVVQLADGSGIVTKDYDYDAFGVQVDSDGSMRYTDVGDALFEDTDTNPWRYCGEYFDVETNTIYLRARYYNPALGRFLAEDTHWNPGNMVYGDNPAKWNERKSDEDDPLRLNSYTYKADSAAIMQSGNLYAYALSNPTTYADPSGELALFVAVTATVLMAYNGALAYYNSTKMGLSGWDARLYILQQQISGGLYGVAAGLLLVPTAGITCIISANIAVGTSSMANIALERGINFTQTTIARMNDINRAVPVQTLLEAITHGVGRPDPQGTKAIMYTIEMYRNGTLYELEVLYDKTTNTILHFVYK